MSQTNAEIGKTNYANFLLIGNQVKVLAERLNISLETSHETRAPHFQKLNAADQAAVIERLKIYRDLFELAVNDAQAVDGSFVSEKKLLWLALRKLNFVPGSQVLNLIDEEDFVEVFVGSRQVYRTFNYYNICSYSFDELESIPWENLFTRDNEITKAIIDEVHQAIEKQDVVVSGTLEHIVEETSSPFKNKIKYKLKYVIPIRDREGFRKDCFLTVISAKLDQTVPKGMRAQRLLEYQQLKEDAMEMGV